jgi:hypothetical protein
MGKIMRGLVPAAAFAGAMLIAGAAAEAACITKAGSGTGGNKDSAMFQAWEAVLQATSWGSWAQFMTSGMKVGTAPGYKVSGFRSSCKAGGLGQTCFTQATLCN